jgi:tetratricopeptide (TPR) repeat protein
MAEGSVRPENIREPEIIANRYRVAQTLGRGGMGTVYKVYDTAHRRYLALKYLRARSDADVQRRTLELFEREYYTLSRLSHPRIVAVYDYGKDDLAPYYTMELLEGGDLRKLSPLPWPIVCAILSDVCSALSFLHSRRFVHRDLTPNNIRCTRDFQAKLFDFGAMIPFGPEKITIGTPQFMAPESYLGQFVDARTDLFALGATAYFALTRRHAYPITGRFTDMRDAWRTRPFPPSHYVPELPEALDHLVLSLIHLDPMARPTSAADVTEKLCAIAGLAVDEHLVVRQSYLSSPTLVGRDDLVLRARKHVVRAMRGRGGTTMITGAAGIGRSRVLDAYAMEAKLAGATVLRANAADAADGQWGGAQALARQLIYELPTVALSAATRFAPILGHVVPEIFDRIKAAQSPAVREKQALDDSEVNQDEYRKRPSWRAIPSTGSLAALKEFESPELMRPHMQAALCDWLLDVSRHRCLMIAVDDIHRLDEPSSALIALLSQYASDHRLSLVVTVERGAPATSDRAISLLTEAGARIELKELSLEDTEKMLGSMFGEAPHLRTVTERLYEISWGNPATVMVLARHLLDRGLVSYKGGTWILPSRIDPQDLPVTLDETYKARLHNVSAGALELAQAIALCSKPSFDYNECLALTSHRDKAQLIGDLNELVEREILSIEGDYFGLRQAAWRSALIAGLPQERASALHLRLAELLEKRGTEPFRSAYHFICAARLERALDLFIEFTSATYARHIANPAEFVTFVQSLPSNWVDILDALLRACETLGRPRLQRFILVQYVIACAAAKGDSRQAYLKEMIDQLYHDCGLDLYQELGDSLEPAVRLEQALTLAQARFDATAEFERVLPPFEAIPKLAQAVVQAIGVLVNGADYESFALLPSLEPLVPLSPALDVVQKNVESTRHSWTGRNQVAQRLWLEVLDRIDQDDHAALDESTWTYTRLAIMYALGANDALDGIESSLRWIEELEKNPVFEVNAWRLRMLRALGQGDAQQAEVCKKRVEMLQIQNSPAGMFETFMSWNVFLGYAAADDLAQVKLTLAEWEAFAERHPNWNLCLHFARGVYNQIRGDLTGALNAFETALRLTPPARYQAWGPIVGGYATTLLALGQAEKALQITEDALRLAEHEGLGTFKRYIEQSLALAEATLKREPSAVAHAEAVIEELRVIGASGVALGSAYETRTRVAIMARDPTAFATYSELCARYYRAVGNPGLTAKHEKLLNDARRAGIAVTSDTVRVIEQSKQLAASVTAALGECRGPDERAHRALELLLQHSGASDGLLFTVQKTGPVLAAQIGASRRPASIDAYVVDFLSAELEEASAVTVTEIDISNRPTEQRGLHGDDGKWYVPHLLSHRSDAGYFVTAVLILCEEPQKKLDIPFGLLQVLSQSLWDAGDVVTAMAAT